MRGAGGVKPYMTTLQGLESCAGSSLAVFCRWHGLAHGCATRRCRRVSAGKWVGHRHNSVPDAREQQREVDDDDDHGGRELETDCDELSGQANCRDNLIGDGVGALPGRRSRAIHRIV